MQDDLKVAVGAVRGTVRREWAIVDTQQKAEARGTVKMPNPGYWATKKRVLELVAVELDRIEQDGVGDVDGQ